MAGFYEFQPTLVDLFQNGFIARQLEEGLDSDLAFRRQATEQTLDGRLGSTIIIPRVGRKAPVVQPLNVANLTNNLDNGLTPSLPNSETYQFQLSEWGDTSDVDTIGSTAASADLVRVASRSNGVQAAQSMERLAKINLFGCYDTGNTWIRGDLGAPTLTSLHVDDIRGFQQVQVNGVLTPVSSQNPLPCVEVMSYQGGVSQMFNVIAATPDNVNASLYPASSVNQYGQPISDGISGVLTIANLSKNTVPVAGDAVVSAFAPKIVRPMNKASYNVLQAGDACTLGLILDALARLKSNNVPTFPDGTYHFIHDPAVMRQLFADQQFLIAYASRYKSEEYQDAQIFELLGVTFIPTTEAYVQAPSPSLGVRVPIRRSILMGAESLLQGNYQGLEAYMNSAGMNTIGGVMMVNGVAQIIRPPIDRMLRILSLTWTWIGDFTCPTDGTATPLIIPTASNALYKRAVVIQTAG